MFPASGCCISLSGLTGRCTARNISVATVSNWNCLPVSRQPLPRRGTARLTPLAADLPNSWLVRANRAVGMAQGRNRCAASIPHLHQQSKRAARGGPFALLGGGGGNRTRVRKPYITGSTCVVCLLFDAPPSGRQGDGALSLLGFNAVSTGTSRRGPEESTPQSRLTGAAWVRG